MDPIVVSAVVLTDADGRILTVRKRGTQRFMLPGGKPEPGEDPADCAVREVREEIGVDLDGELVHVGRFTDAAANEPGRLVEAQVYAHPAPAGVAAAAEIDEIRWLDPHAPLPGDLAPLLVAVITPGLTGPRTFTYRRPFGWGVVRLSDHDADIPEVDTDVLVTAGPQAAIALVHHAADVEVPDDWPDHTEVPPAEVTVRVHVDLEMPANPTWQGDLETPTGTLLIGDAAGDVEVAVGSPRTHVALRLDPEEDADLLEIWVGAAR